MNRETLFDPLGKLAVASAGRPPGLSAVNLRVLSPFHRCLLVIDGTVTEFIEAYTLEPVAIRLISQEVSSLAESDRWLEAREGTRVALRRVSIEGAYSGTLFVYAVSVIVFGRLPEPVERRLRTPGQGIGRLLNEYELESRREILWFGRERGTDVNREIGREGDDDFVSRSYRIVVGGKPVAMITEKFPLDVERSLASH